MFNLHSATLTSELAAETRPPGPPAGIGEGNQPSQTQLRFDRFAVASLIAVVGATRFGLLGNSYGESDTARFVTGLRQWLSAGPTAPEIYSNRFSPGYYWLLAHIVRALHVSPASFPLLLNVISASAAILTAPLAYYIGRRIAGDRLIALTAAALWLLGPAMWWLGIEPHPQGLSIAAFLLSIYCWLRAWQLDRSSPRSSKSEWGAERALIRWCLLSTVALVMSLLFKSDVVLFFGAYVAIAAFGALPQKQTDQLPLSYWKRLLRPVLIAAAMLAAASLLFVAGRTAILAESINQTQTAVGHAMQSFLEVPLGVEFVRQIIPILFGPGLFVSGFILGGLALGAWHYGKRWSLEWTVLLLPWVLPGTVFWFAIRGNNARHIAAFSLPVLWAACEAWKRTGRARLLTGAAVTALLASWIVPASSNITLYPSGNVPASAHLLHAREAEMKAAALRLAQAGPGFPLQGRSANCYVGSYTVPYVLDSLLSTAPGFSSGRYKPIGLTDANYWIHLPQTDVAKAPVDLYTLEPGLNLNTPRHICESLLTLEFNDNGSKRWYMGSEVRRAWRVGAPLPVFSAVQLH